MICYVECSDVDALSYRDGIWSRMRQYLGVSADPIG